HREAAALVRDQHHRGLGTLLGVGVRSPHREAATGIGPDGAAGGAAVAPEDGRAIVSQPAVGIAVGKGGHHAPRRLPFQAEQPWGQKRGRSSYYNELRPLFFSI